jgi:dolichol-phosphate mannosyltransferase
MLRIAMARQRRTRLLELENNMTSQTGLITLALPCYNEADNIVSVMQASIVELEKLGRPWELIVIDNHSSDRTAEVVQEFIQTESRVRLIVHPENKLYSGSCATALREARGELVAIMDSDRQFSAVDLPRMIASLEAGANLVIGWRKERHDPFARKLMSAVFNAMGKFWLGFPLHDLNCGIRMFDRKFIEVAEIRHRINMVNPEMYVRAYNAGLRLDEVVITHAERTEGQTSHDFRKSYHIFMTVNTYFRTLKGEKRKREVTVGYREA